MSLVGYSPWGYKESDMTEWLTHIPKPVTSKENDFDGSRIIFWCFSRTQPSLVRQTYFPQPRYLNRIRTLVNKDTFLDYNMESNWVPLQKGETAKSFVFAGRVIYIPISLLPDHSYPSWGELRQPRSHKAYQLLWSHWEPDGKGKGHRSQVRWPRAACCVLGKQSWRPQHHPNSRPQALSPWCTRLWSPIWAGFQPQILSQSLALPNAGLLPAYGVSLGSHQRCLLRVVGFWLMHTDSQAHRLVEGIWAGFSLYKPPRRAPLSSSSVAHIQKPCPSQAPGCCIFYTQLLLNVLVGFCLEQVACQLGSFNPGFTRAWLTCI